MRSFLLYDCGCVVRCPFFRPFFMISNQYMYADYIKSFFNCLDMAWGQSTSIVYSRHSASVWVCWSVFLGAHFGNVFILACILLLLLLFFFSRWNSFIRWFGALSSLAVLNELLMNDANKQQTWLKERNISHVLLLSGRAHFITVFVRFFPSRLFRSSSSSSRSSDSLS